MEVILAEDLFPISFSAEERANHWVSFSSFFISPHAKALSSILSQKRRLQTEMQVYIGLREKEKENISEEEHQKIFTCFTKMSTSFVEPSKAEEGFRLLHQLKDKHIFKELKELVDERTTYSVAQSIRDSFLRRIGNKHPCYDFFKVLSLKCSNCIFTAEHVLYFLKEYISKKNEGNESSATSVFDLLSTIVNIFPSLLRGSEKYFLTLFSEEDSSSTERLLQMLVRVAHHISIKLSDIYPCLEKLCLDGTRAQSKLAVSVIATLVDKCDTSTICGLCEGLVGSLHSGHLLCTALQSLGCIAQNFSIPKLFEDQIKEFIFDKIFHFTKGSLSSRQSPAEGIVDCCEAWKHKIYGLKTLAKIFLAPQDNYVKSEVKELLDFLLKILEKGDVIDVATSSDQARVRLAAAKSVIRLSKRWDFHISPRLFHLTVLMARDPSPIVREVLLKKIHCLLKKHVIPIRYACAFGLALSDLCHQADRYLAEFIEDYSHEAGVGQIAPLLKDTEGVIHQPEYIVVFLIHALAHDRGFPSEDCQDEDSYAGFFWPINVVLRGFLEPLTSCKRRDTANSFTCLFGILRAISQAEDAVDDFFTPRLQMLSRIGLLMIQNIACNPKPSPNVHRTILLPSSFYKVRSSLKNRESLSGKKLFSCERLVDRILNAKPDSQLGKSSFPQQQEPSGFRDKVLIEDKGNPAQIDAYIDNTKRLLHGKQASSDAINRRREKEHSSGCTLTEKKGPSSPSVELLEENPQLNECTGETIRNSEPDREPGRLPSSCGSAVTRPSFDSQVLANDIVVVDRSSPEANTKSNTSRTHPLGPSESIKSKDTANCNEALVGRCISLWSPLNKCFQSGTVNSYDSRNKTHKVTYDDGKERLLSLHNEKWEVIQGMSSSKKDGNKLQFKDWLESSDGSDEELLDISHYKVSSHGKENKMPTERKRTSSPSGNRISKRLKTSTDTNRKPGPKAVDKKSRMASLKGKQCTRT